MTGGPETEAFPNTLLATDQAAARCRRRLIRCQARAYDRGRHLPGLLALPRHVRHLPEPVLTCAIVAGLKRALRYSLALRNGRNWCYSRWRHTALLVALCGELGQLRRRPGRGAA